MELLVIFSLIFTFSYHFWYANAFSKVDCQGYNVTSLYGLTNKIANQVDSILIPKYFKKSVSGYYKIIVDEERGLDNGGGSNTFGSYGSFLFTGSDIFPEEFCNIPTNDGTARCIPYTDSFILGPADAVVFIGCTPPSVRYFSFDVDVDTRLIFMLLQ